MVIFHNPKCSKSRATLAILEQQGVDFEVIRYLENPPSKNQLKSIIAELGISAKELMRKGEDEFRLQNLQDPNLSEDALIEAMVKTPKLIERPIVRGKKGTIIGRPPENVIAIL